MAENSKQTVYIDVDDDITTIIDKVNASPKKIVALVLPKRSSALQSIVNMKLLKKTAAKAKKSLVLITSDHNLLPLAGVVGLHVAKSLQSKPAIPLMPERGEAEEMVTTDLSDDGEVNKAAAVGALAAASANEDETETIELDDTPAEATTTAKAPKGIRKHLKVPNFDKFRLTFFLAIAALLLLIVGWIFAFVIMPRAEVTIATDTTTVPVSVSFTANTAQASLDTAQKLLPAVSKEVKKTDTEKVPATGKMDKGTKATGTMTVYNCTDNDVAVPAGTIFSNGSFSFSSNEAVSVPYSDFKSDGTCRKNRSATVGVTATKAGADSNLSGNREYSSNFRNTVTGTGSAMTGGTTNLVTVVSQSDIDNAADKMKGRLDADAATELGQQFLSENLQRLEETRVIGSPSIKSSPAVNEEASEVTVTAETTYSELGVKADDLNELVKQDVATKIDINQQSIVDNGLSQAVFRVEARKSPTEATVNLQVLALVGPELNETTIKDQIKGKKRGDAEKYITSLPGVKDVTVEYKPFWVLSTPKAAKKIKVTIQKPIVAETATPETTNEAQ
jgi:hypothetical protein